MSDKGKLKSIHAPKESGDSEGQRKLYSEDVFEEVTSHVSVYYYTKRLTERSSEDNEKSTK